MLFKTTVLVQQGEIVITYNHVGNHVTHTQVSYARFPSCSARALRCRWVVGTFLRTS